MIDIPRSTSASSINTRRNITTNFPQVFTEPEAAKWLRVSRITLQRVRLRGEISFSRVGGVRVVYTYKNLTDYLASRERTAFKT